HRRAQLIHGNQRLAAPTPVLRACILHRHRLDHNQPSARKRCESGIQNHVAANNSQSHALTSSTATGAAFSSTRPITTIRAGVLLPSLARTISPSLETITVVPIAAPCQSTTTFGSAVMLPSASIR